MPPNQELSVELPVQIAHRVDEQTRRLESQVKGSDRRRFQRVAVGITAHCQIDGVISDEGVGDLSLGGLMLRTAAPVRKGAIARIVLYLPYVGTRHYCSLNGTVVWVRPDTETGAWAAGVEFDADVSDTDREILKGFLFLWGSPRDIRAADGG